MTDRSHDPATSPDPGRTPDPDGSTTPEAPDNKSGGRLSRALAGSERSLDRRWWWHAAVMVIVGIAIIGFQWEVITTGQAIWGTWVMVVIGAVLIVAGGITAWRDRPDPSEQP